MLNQIWSSEIFLEYSWNQKQDEVDECLVAYTCYTWHKVENAV